MDNEQLRAIARDAMLQRGLQPDFCAAAQRQLDTIERAAAEQDPAIRDLRDLPWCSIDNDDSRDLDQLSVARAAAGGAPARADPRRDRRRRRDCWPSRLADRRARAHNTTSVYTAAGIFPMLPEKLSTDLTLAQRGRGAPGDRRRDGRRCGRRSPIDGVRRVPRASCGTTPSSPTTPWPPGSTATRASAAQASPRCRGLDEQLRLQDRVAQAMKTPRHAARRAQPRDDRSAARVRATAC